MDSQKDATENLGSSRCSTAVQRDLDMAAVYSESLQAMREASRGLACKQVDVANMLLLLKAAKHLLLAAKGPVGGPTCWDETRRRWLEAYKNVKP
jgi:hypothetical protein